MLFLCRTTIRLRNIRTFAALSIKRGISPKYDAVQNLLNEHARLLRLVEKRIHERAKLQSEVLWFLSGDLRCSQVLVALGRHVFSGGHSPLEAVERI
jgi:regulator of sirC expression with transglutaminase-like and TPR domain